MESKAKRTALPHLTPTIVGIHTHTPSPTTGGGRGGAERELLRARPRSGSVPTDTMLPPPPSLRGGTRTMLLLLLLTATTAAAAADRSDHSSRSSRSVFVTNGLWGLAFASYLSYRGLRKGSLSRDGAMAAWIVGFLTMLTSLRFGVVLILFYQSSSTLTKFRAEVKARFEEDHAGQPPESPPKRARQPAAVRGGGDGKGGKGEVQQQQQQQASLARTATQVLACSVLATGIAAAHAWLLGPDDHRPLDFSTDPLRARLLCAFVGHYACCNGDTWASEIGILSPASPRLVTSFLLRRPVPRGTNGGVSWTGTLASVAGGAFIGAGHTLAGWLLLGARDAVGPGSLLPAWAYMTALGAICGLLGSMLDSVLGALLQPTWFCQERKRVVKHPTPKERRTGVVTLISGRDVLTNEQVNALSVLITTAAAPAIGRALWGAK